MSEKTNALKTESKRQAEACLYTSTSLFIWLRDARFMNRCLNAAPIILGAVATYSAFQALSPYLTAFSGFLAGLLPSIYEELKLKQHTREIERQAGEYKNLQDRFRQLAEITALGNDEQHLQNEFEALMLRLEELRAKPITAPEKYFLDAQTKIKAGHYDPDKTE